MQKASTKIKIIGIAIFSLLVILISTTYIIVKNNINDSHIINIAGKERMLSQKIGKYIYYSTSTKNTQNSNIQDSISEFELILHKLKNGDKQSNIYAPPTQPIQKQIEIVETLWNEYKLQINNSFDAQRFYEISEELLSNINTMVRLYEEYAKQIKLILVNIQIFFAILFIAVIVYAYMTLIKIEEKAKLFMTQTKDLANQEVLNCANIIEIKNTNDELDEISSDINSFITKINNTLQHFQKASNELESIYSKFDNIIVELSIDKDELSKVVDKGEDTTIQVIEKLAKSQKMLTKLKNDLSNILSQCEYKRG